MDSTQLMQQIASLLVPATVNVSNFVPIKLWFTQYPYTNYVVWREQMLCLIQSQGLLGYIDGSEADSDDVWRRNDSLVRGWILGAISDDIASTVLGFLTARDVWLELENKFQQFSNPAPILQTDSQPEDPNYNLALYKAAIEGNWEAAQRMFNNDPYVSKTWLDGFTTTLHIAVRNKKTINFFENMVALIPDDELIALRNSVGNTALNYAAAVGNKAAATILVKRMPNLLYIPNKYNDFPVHMAALYCKKDMVEYLISITEDDVDPNPIAHFNGLRLLIYVIQAEFFDTALYLIHKYPYLAELRQPNTITSALMEIINKLALLSETSSPWERFMPSRISVKTMLRSNSSKSIIGDIEKIAYDSHEPVRVSQNLHVKVWELAEKFVPQVRIAKDKIKAKQQALQIVKSLCDKLKSITSKKAGEICGDAMLKAAELGVREVVEIIADTFPNAIDYYSRSGKNIFHKAVAHRCEHVYNLVYQMSDEKDLYVNVQDKSNNSLLHLAAKLAPSRKLDKISGAALQMQRELQWYKVVESIVYPAFREFRDTDGKTPKMLFTEEHKEMKENGEKWMKDTATSCTIAATLITTVMFAAAITVPGGNKNDTGFPIFSKEIAFIVFAISDAFSLFTSATSLLMFLSILASRYAEEDFLHVLPKRLIIGLGTLFFSITFMMVSFSATLYLVFGQKNEWVLIPTAALACLPVASFVLLQFPLLTDLISSTYGPGIFRKESDLPFN